jgi:hypothetical protein
MPHLTLLKTNPFTRINTYSVLCKNIDSFGIKIKNVKTHDIDVGFLTTYEFDIPMTKQGQKITYSVNDIDYTFHVPHVTQELNVFYSSCNHTTQLSVWDIIKEQHLSDPYHLAIGGGDQIYMDDVWKLPCLKNWHLLSSNEKLTYEPSDQTIHEISQFYKNTYDDRWFESYEYMHVLPQIPSINMWDDHEIIDGYGSYPSNVQNSPIMKAIYKVARRAFMIYQLHMKPDDFNHNLTNMLEINKTLFVNIDTRTERCGSYILSKETHTRIFKHIESSKAHNVIILLSTPVAFYNMDWLKSVYKCLPYGGGVTNIFGLAKYLDDIVDGWGDKSHDIERDGMMEKLFAMRTKNIAIVVGDVHINGSGYVEKQGIRIPQYISSGIGSQVPKTFFNLMSLLGGKRISNSIKYFFDKTTANREYNWGNIKIDTDIKFIYHTQK